MRIALLPALCVLLSLSAQAETMLCNFETEEEFAAWSVRSAQQDRFVQSDRFVTSGAHSALFESPKWCPGMQQWPAFEFQPPVRDWSGAEALVMDLVNPTGQLEPVNVYFTDSETPFRSGAVQRFYLEPYSHQRVRVPVSTLASKIDVSDIELMHFFLTRPPEDFVLYLDRMVLLGEGEEQSALPNSFEAGMLEVGRDETEFEQARQAVEESTESVAGDDPWAQARKKELLEEWGRAHDQAFAEDASLEDYRNAVETVRKLSVAASRITSLTALRAAWLDGNRPETYAAGFATAMEKILPRGMPFELDVTNTAEIELARNETESFQVAVVPFTHDLKGVRVEIGRLTSSDGTQLPADSVTIRTVGFVETKRPPYEVPYAGWWPDPLLDFLPEVSVAAGDVQTFWVSVEAPPDAAPGIYEGQGRLAAGNAPGWEFAVRVRVYGFSVPGASPLPTAMSMYDQYARKFVPGDWEPMALEYAGFLAGYYIDYDSLYRTHAPDYAVLQHLEEQGRLVAFNVRYFSKSMFKPDMDDAALKRVMDPLCEEVAGILERARELGIEDKAYIYGFDECRPEWFPVLQRICERLKSEFPDLPTMTTTYDDTYGVASGVNAMDIWVPLTPSYHPERAEAARARGKHVWWYICIGPKHPHANWLIEYPAIEARLLMGAMTAKYRPEGFLYYALTRWPNNDKPITSGPFTSWNPASFKVNNGDGSLLCPGPGGRPLATIRLENFRDGLEDYAYVLELEHRLSALRARWDTLPPQTRQTVEEAERLVNVPEQVVKSLTEFTHDPQAVYKYRRAVAEAIESLKE